MLYSHFSSFPSEGESIGAKPRTTDFGQENDRDHPFVESAGVLQCYKDIKFPMEEHALREEKHLSKEG